MPTTTTTSRLRLSDDISKLVGETPMLHMRRLSPAGAADVFAKLEYLNPGGSVKDRAAIGLIERAEREGKLKPGGTVIEATAGNTGIGLALIGVNRGYKVRLFVPEKFSEEKVIIMRALGAEVVRTPESEGMQGAIQRARDLQASNPNAFLAAQFDNQANTEYHYETTAREIFEQMEGRVDAITIGCGTAGTFSGVARFLKERLPNLFAVAVETEGSILGGGKPAPHKVEGIGNTFIPGNFDRSVCDEVFKVTDEQAFGMVKQLAAREGVLGGSSAGANVYAAIEIAKRLGAGKRVATMIPDSAERYLSKKSSKVASKRRALHDTTRILEITLAKQKSGFATKAIHVGQEPDPLTGAVSAPIYPTSTYVQEEIGKNKGYEYARVSNPTRDRLETNLAALEGGSASRVFGSGMAAINAITSMLKAGDHVVAGHNLYGGTPRLFNQVLTNFGLTFTYVDTSDVKKVEKAFQKNTRLLFVETPTNPLMELCDLAAIAKLSHQHDVELVVDNTFTSPYFQRPIEFGADMVVHSTTKFLNGHSDGLGGVVVCTKPEQAEKLAFLQKCAGAILSPFECWLILRGVKTLAVRMEQHDRSGRKVADYLAKHKKVKKVFYPGLPDHPQHELAKRQMTGFGSMITFETGSLENANSMLRKVRVCSLAESLGGVETLISHPATMTHAGVGEEGRHKIGITDGMVRISVGIEDVDDILADLDQALAAI